MCSVLCFVFFLFRYFKSPTYFNDVKLYLTFSFFLLFYFWDKQWYNGEIYNQFQSKYSLVSTEKKKELKLSALEYRFLLVQSSFGDRGTRNIAGDIFFVLFVCFNIYLYILERLKTCENATEKHKVDARDGNRVFHSSVR